MTDELLVLTGLDQPIPADSKEILQRVEEIIRKSVEERNAYTALDACKTLVQVSKVSGVALAKALYLIEKNWDNYDETDEFEDIAYIYIGLHKHTVERYTVLWKMYAEKLIPDNVSEEIQQHNVKTQIPIALALEQGYEIDDAEWEKLAHAPDLNTVSKILREEVKGKPPRKGSLQAWIDDLGSIWATYKGEKFFAGSLEVDSDEEAVQMLIERIKKGAGIL
jgi:hypothetical protein